MLGYYSKYYNAFVLFYTHFTFQAQSFSNFYGLKYAGFKSQSVHLSTIFKRCLLHWLKVTTMLLEHNVNYVSPPSPVTVVIGIS